MAFFFKNETSPSLIMSLFPYEDVLTKEIESWKGFADGLHTDEDRKVGCFCRGFHNFWIINSEFHTDRHGALFFYDDYCD
jgi:hypothetical protein